MHRIDCPWCGVRDEAEFKYGGDAWGKRSNSWTTPDLGNGPLVRAVISGRYGSSSTASRLVTITDGMMSCSSLLAGFVQA